MARIPSFSAVLLGLFAFSPAPQARAEYAAPPRYAPPPDHDRADDRYPPEYDEEWEPRDEPRSTVRLFTGPAARFGDGRARAGLFAAADVGAGAAGVRASGTFIGTGNDGGFSLYSGELFVDFGRGGALHPIVAAGAGYARLEHEKPRSSDLELDELGVGVLRGTLQYRFRVEGVDARAGVDLSAHVRAFGTSEHAPPAWITTAATVGVGF